MNRNRTPGSGQITARLIIVRAGHVIAARGTEQLAAPRLQPLRAGGTIPRRILGTGDETRTTLQRRNGFSCGLCRLGMGPGLAPTSRRVPRLDGYSTVEGNRG